MAAPDTFEREAVCAKIVENVTPYLGQTMARASVQTHLQKLGIDGQDVTIDQIEALVNKIGMGLVIFVGRDKSAQIVRELHSAVRSMGGAQ
jgi:reverse gyrase